MGNNIRKTKRRSISNLLTREEAEFIFKKMESLVMIKKDKLKVIKINKFFDIIYNIEFDRLQNGILISRERYILYKIIFDQKLNSNKFIVQSNDFFIIGDNPDVKNKLVSLIEKKIKYLKLIVHQINWKLAFMYKNYKNVYYIGET